MTSKLRPEVTPTGAHDAYTPENGTAYLMIYNAVMTKDQLVHGHLHRGGESCAIGSYWDVNPKCSLKWSTIEEVAAVNDSVPNATPRQRRLVVLRWLRWKLTQAGMPGFKTARR